MLIGVVLSMEVDNKTNHMQQHLSVLYQITNYKEVVKQMIEVDGYLHSGMKQTKPFTWVELGMCTTLILCY